MRDENVKSRVEEGAKASARGRGRRAHNGRSRAAAPDRQQFLAELRESSELRIARRRATRARELFAQTKAFDNLAIPIWVTTIEVIEQPPALVDHHDQPAPRGVVFHVRLQVRGQIVDPLAQQCDLYFRRAGVLGMCTVLLDQR